MAKRICNTGDNEEAVTGDEDRLSALPDVLIQMVLSFLPSPEAVRTCVLATRWRNLWKSVPSLRISTLCSVDFVNSLIWYRDPTPLHECEILVEADVFSQSRRAAEQWLRYAVSCKVRVLRFEMLNYSLHLSAGALVSEHLTRLDLFRIGSVHFPLDVLSCQSLVELEIYQCVINIGTEFPKSLRLLRIRDTNFLPTDTRSFISAPGLVTFELADCSEWTPFPKSMPSLVTASIRIGPDCYDSSYEGLSVCSAMDFSKVCGGRSCMQCYGFLKGLSGATNLELIGHCSMIFRREIKLRPMFSKLKTVILGDWCMSANFRGLVYFLQHSPILERFMLQLGGFSEEDFVGASEIYKPNEQFLVSNHLKAVKIKYCQAVGNIDQIVNVLAYHGVQPELIIIGRKPYIGRFSSERKW